MQDTPFFVKEEVGGAIKVTATDSAYYTLYGICMHVSGTFERLAAVPAAPEADVTLHLGGLPQWALSISGELCYGTEPESPEEYSSLRIYRLTHKPYYLFRFPEEINFLVNQDGRQIQGDWPKRFSLDYVAPLILGPLMGHILRFQGVTALHGSVIEIGGRAVVMIGSAGAGKSTTAAAFAKLGYRILSDDLAALRPSGNCFVVSPGYPRICLWPESVKFLFGSQDALPLITEGWEKKYLDLAGEQYRFCPEELPLGAIYLLSDQIESDAPSIADMPTQNKLSALLVNAYGAGFQDLAASARELQDHASILRAVPVRRVADYRDSALITTLCATIAKDFQNVQR